MSFVSRSVKALLHVEDTPHRIALAFGIGVYIAFFPIWGIHTLMALGIAFAFRLSRAAMVIGAYVNNPWTVAPFYGAGTMLGCVILGAPVQASPLDIDWSLRGMAFVEAFAESLRPYIWPFVVGNTVVGVVGGLIGYLGLRFLLERRRRGIHHLPPTLSLPT